MSDHTEDPGSVEEGGVRDEETRAAARARELIEAEAPGALGQFPGLFKEGIQLARTLEGVGEAGLTRALRERVKALHVEKARRLLKDESKADDSRTPSAIIKFARRLEELGEKEPAVKLLEKLKGALVDEARDILRGTKKSPAEILSLAESLSKLDEFNFGWRVLDRALDHPDFGKTDTPHTKIIQRRALYTYKDVTQPLGKRLDEALEFLEKRAGIPEKLTPEKLAAATRDQETLGLAGSIYKRKWELDKQDRHLRASRDFYKRGYEQTPWGDQGYTSINYAYLLDMMAHLDPHRARELRAEARKVRLQIVDEAPNMLAADAGLANAWFFYSTVGEAYFGLGRFAEARAWLVTKPEAELVRPPDWEFETSARQLAGMARLQSDDADFDASETWGAFKEFLGASVLGKGGDVSVEAVRQLPEGKIGLALSGGGFRASLFHIGVLARLAELDVLRRVEVLSCVSGGSIVGAHYYLEVRKLLQRKADEKITRRDYICIVRRLEKKFLLAVQTNIRTNVVTDARVVRRMLRRDYSRTTRLGELYEEQIYARVADEVGATRGADGRVRERYMHELVVTPPLSDGRPWEDFKPRNHNWRREAKVPILIINAATLNTGHNWQFTATYMGEAPATIHPEVDSVYRLRRKYYKEGPHTAEKPQLVRLGTAVAASSCVPVLFEPVVLEDLYDTRDGGEKISVKLVDGGVCDNQGVAGLLEQDCTVLLVSDGSGHLGAVDRPSNKALSVGLRANEVLQARIRGTQYRELDARRSASMLNGLMFVHLKKDLDNPPVDWKGCPAESQLARPDDRNDLTKYNVSKEVQKKLAAIRTDLDTFCDQEAYALMLSAYRMTDFEFRERLPEMGRQQAPQASWKFLHPRLRRAIKEPGPEQDGLNKLLDTAGGKFFRVWKLDERLKARARRWKMARNVAGILALVAFLLVTALAGYALWRFFFAGDAATAPPFALTWLGVAAALLLLFIFACGVAFVVYLMKLRGTPEIFDALAHTAVGSMLLVVACPAARVHMRKYESLYLKLGKLDTLPE